MDIKKINEIVEVFKNSGLGEMALELKDFKITMKSNNKEILNLDYTTLQSLQAKSPGAIPEVENKEVLAGEWVKAPFVGTFYAAPSANDAPFVKVGQKINKGDVLCILEAMKVMNEIKANKSGTIVEIKAQNGEMVEFDEELILIGD